MTKPISESNHTDRAPEQRAGRNCPLPYRYSACELALDVPFEAECVYVIGGLYGNLPALDAITALAALEPTPPRLVFNGDFNWFNVDRDAFAVINRRVLEHTALRGNVETELATDDSAAGCGCGYPASVSDAEVERSNRILERLRGVARGFPDLRARLGDLPMHAVAVVGGIRVGIVHGDCESLAGWGLAEDALRTDRARMRAAWWCEQADVRVIASSHSCLPVAVDFDSLRGVCAVFNNGAAGMPNFAGGRYGIITRISVRPAVSAEVPYRTRIAATWVEAVAVRYDQARWLQTFVASWAPDSPAHRSYFARISQGPRYSIGEACRLSASL